MKNQKKGVGLDVKGLSCIDDVKAVCPFDTAERCRMKRGPVNENFWFESEIQIELNVNFIKLN